MSGREKFERPPGGDDLASDIPEAVRRAWDELDAPEPPDLVDQAVLNRARAAVEEPASGRSSRPWSFGWMHTVTTAAVIVLGLTVLLPLRDEAPGRGGPDTPAPALQRSEMADEILEEESMEVRSVEQQADQPVERRGVRGNLGATAAEPEAETAPAAAPVPAPGAASSPTPTDADAESGPGRQVTPAERRARTPGAETPVSAADADTVAPTHLLKDSAERETAGRDDTPPDPETWLADIRALIAAGESEAAQASLDAFRLAYPDHPLPEDLSP